MYVQVEANLNLDHDTILTPKSGVIVYLSDLERLIKGQWLTGEVYM